MEKNKHKHMTIEERIEIQVCLDRGMTFKAIGSRIGKDQTTVSKEIKKHLVFTPNETAVCRDQNGKELSVPVCPKLLKAPFVCNPCEKKRYRCQYQKQKYIAKFAQKEYEELLVFAREGIPLNKEEFYAADRVITAGIQKGQHLYHILQSNELNVSKSAVYRHLQNGYLSVSAVEFPRVVKFKPRRQKHIEYVPKVAKVGRTYSDFLMFTEKHEITSWVEMDTVIGSIGGKVILTLHFTLCNFMVGLLLDSKSASEVSEKIISLKKSLEQNGICFGNVFPVILTDNGSEFANVLAIENDLHGTKETHTFFCDPYKSCQKPRVEKNHTLFRDISPKGQSFDDFSQNTVSLIFSHVNSVKRKVLFGKTPYEMFSYTYGEKIVEILGVKSVPADEVVQSPKLLTL